MSESCLKNCQKCGSSIWSKETGQIARTGWDLKTICISCHRSAEEVLARAVVAVLALAEESEGVTGYHRNGDVATWDWLMHNVDGALEELAEARDYLRIGEQS